jgi:hypothetical protein
MKEREEGGCQGQRRERRQEDTIKVGHSLAKNLNEHMKYLMASMLKLKTYALKVTLKGNPGYKNMPSS